MIKLDNIKELGLKITWQLLHLGFQSCEIFNGSVSAEEVIDFAIELMEKDVDNLDIFELSCEYNTNVENISKCLEKLSYQENTNYNIEFRKWRVAYVINNLPLEGEDCVRGLIQLGDIWCVFNFPDDSPHTYQERNNMNFPEQYYSNQNYRLLLIRHNEWIEEELKFLMQQDKLIL